MPSPSARTLGYNRSQQATTSTDGSFYVPPFLDVSCNRIRLSSQKMDDLWLKTGHDIFYGGDNGTTPVVEASQSGPPKTAEITLGDRGGLISFRVRDTATDRFIWAGLYLQRATVPGRKFGSMQIATGRDGSPDRVLLPAGEYVISVEWYSCKGVDYFTVNPPRDTLTVEAGQRSAKDILVDIRAIKPVGKRPCKL